jgi:DNA-binding NarL/FixJ family response regulator
LDGGRDWSQWTHVEAQYASNWAEAAPLLEAGPFDVALLDLELEDSSGKETFRRYQATARRTPAVLLIRAEAEVSLAEHLLREGAQDFLLWKQIDCAPLARAMRNAVDRHRLLAAAQAVSMVDSLTGLLSRDAFLLLADRDRHLAESLQRRQLVILAAPQIAPGDDEQRDLDVMDAADSLRNMAGATDLVARVSLIHLALSVIDSERESVEEIWARMHSSAEKKGIALGVAVFDPERPVALDRLLELAAQDMKPAAKAAS